MPKFNVVFEFKERSTSNNTNFDAFFPGREARKGEVKTGHSQHQPTNGTRRASRFVEIFIY